MPFDKWDQLPHIRSLKIESTRGEKEAFLGGDVSEYIRANITMPRQDSITITSDITTHKLADTSPPIRLDWRVG